MQVHVVKVPLDDSGKRLDIFISDFFKNKSLGISRTYIQVLIRTGKVKLGGGVLSKPHYKIKLGDELTIVIEDKRKSSLESEDIPLDVVYEDKDLAVINKLPGLVVHPAPGNCAHTLVNALLYRFKELSDINPDRPGIVHRLDKETSGLIVIAKNNAAHLALAAQFAKHTVKRKYVALVKGEVTFDENIIELPIGRHPFKRKNMAVGFGKKTRYAKTYYRTLKRNANFSLLELEPFTGRTHQLRVHLSFLGHPVLGDNKYGKNNDFVRLALHAYYIGFLHPANQKFVEFRTQMPKELAEFSEKIQV
jgi:23S rRNA pseudouridine1911/1915/1917 synthase